ncbi:MAG: hypothetical protein PHQ75_00625 [Thermoguttaceae bacterium]|nr:hypothetical protein [Thermoguttaceae bacterium]
MNIYWIIERYNASTSGWGSDWQLRLTISWDAVEGADEYIITCPGQDISDSTDGTSLVYNRCTFVNHQWNAFRITANASGVELNSCDVNIGYFLPIWAQEPAGDNTNGVTMSFEVNDVEFPIVIERLISSGWNSGNWTRLGTAQLDAESLTFHDANPIRNSTNTYRAYYETEHYSDMNKSYLEGSATVSELQLPPSDITLSNNTISYADSYAGNFIGILSVTDPNTNDYANLTLPAGLTDNSLFSIVYGNYLYVGMTPLNAGNYIVTVRATDSTGLTFDKILEIIVTPVQLDSPAPQVEPDAFSIHAYWSEIDDATGYECSLSDDGNNWGDSLATSDAEIDFTGLESETLYYIRVRATSDSGNYSASVWSSVVSCTTLKPPTAPTDIFLSNNTIDYENAVTGEVIGELSASDPNEGDYVTFSLPDNTGNNGLFAIDGNYLVIGQNKPDAGTYSIVVRATDSTGLIFEKTFSFEITPSQLQQPWPWTNATSTSIILEWDENDIPCTYEVQTSADGMNWSESISCTDSQYVLSDLANETTLYFRVRCIASDNNYSNSDWSDVVSGVTLGPPPKPTATAISQHVILVTWPNDTGPVSIERTLCDTNEWTQLATDYYDSSFTDSTALPNQRYLYRLVSGTCCSPPDPAWLSTITHYSVVTECHEGTVAKVEWQVITELTV